ncbi:MAG: protein kinase [Gemmatimonadetes bacterium]|nr:protein kinase [Gemmatimonadota bacterium]
MTEITAKLSTALAGNYEIDKEIGHGGMATVYLARDLKHNRQVAVKVLRPDLAAALGHERFLREIEIAANLTHPHILPLYDSGEADGFLYYVMPYIEGDTLRDRIEKEGELPVAEAVRIVREVTDALAFAHSQGVVHRDIKPDNIMLSGRHAMVMDFGVAKAVSEATGRVQLTTVGVALGTPTYMAPEQATADPHVDHRADIYAVGIMAYELLAGRTPFQGASPQAVLAAHVTEEPEPVSKYRGQVSPELESVIMKCLAKRPADRWQSADEMLPLLETISSSVGGLTPTGTRPLQAVRPRRVWWMALGAVATAAVIGVFGARMIKKEPLRVTVANVRQVTHSPMMDIFPDISNDGSEIVYSAGQGISYHLYLSGTQGGPALGFTEDRPGRQWRPRWSPSGREVRFEDVREIGMGAPVFLMEISKLGGSARLLPEGLVAESDAVELYATGRDSVQVRDRASGDVLNTLLLPVADFSYAQASPDGSRLAYTSGNFFYYSSELLGNDVPTSIWVTGLDQWSPVRITPDEYLDIHPTWLGNDRLLFISNRDGQRDIYLVALNRSGEPAGEPVRVTTGADVHTLSVTPDGSLVAYSKLRFRSNLYQVILPERGSVSLGEARPLTRESAVIEQHDRSADGRMLLYDSNVLGQQDIYLMPVDGGQPQRVTTDPGQDMNPEFSPDQSEILFYSTRNGTRDLYLIGVDGQNLRRLTGREEDGWGAEEQEIFPTFSPDGRRIAFGSQVPGGPNRLKVMTRDSMTGTWGTPVVLADSVGSYGWAPDSRRIIFSTTLGRLRTVTLDGEVEDVPNDPISRFLGWPFWMPDGRIFYRGTGSDGVHGIYVLDRLGADPRIVVRFDDPRVVSESARMTIRGNSLVLTVTEKESDIYVMELEY